MNYYKRRKRYQYRFMWTVKNQGGTSESYVIRRSSRASSRKKAEEVAEAHRRDLRLSLVHPRDPWPQPAPREAPRLRDFFTRFLEYAAVKTKPETARFYSECLNRVLCFSPPADAVLTNVTSEHITKYANWRRNRPRGNSLATVNGELRTLRRVFNLAEEWGFVPKALAIHELPGEKGRERVLSFEEEAAYLRAASTTLRDVIILAVDTGMCPDSELFPLAWANVRLEPTSGASNGFIHVVQGKTQYRRRNVPLTPRARTVLEVRRAACGDGQYVFPGKGRLGHLTSVQHPHVRAIRNVGLEPFEFYCWRHTFGTRCAESGMDKFALARLMGHSSPEWRSGITST